MLEGIPLEDNPFIAEQRTDPLTILYEDASFIVVHKPADLLSVPGLVSEDSVYSRLQKEFGIAEPLIIHRLDMPTSGILVVAKTKQAHKQIQKQFLNRTVEKRYTALLSKRIEGEEGEISLPLRGDFDDRPRQLVCFEHGKPAQTRWKIVEKNKDTTRIHFWPLTGRTHQLRMHSAHPLGLNAPIIGDDLYGKPANRLHLHAAFLALIHPITKEKMIFEAPDPF
jgi:tRNA pseudouridine32 synthase/23S rRNA pseudouridine746 synthase